MPETLMRDHQEFDRNTLLAPEHKESVGLALLHPNRFSINQSYSLSFSSGSLGSTSSGLYLNTLAYQLADPLRLSVDVGFHTPFHATGAFSRVPGYGDPGIQPSFILPHVGLEYKPTRNTVLSLNYFNGPDALKAYGYPSDFHFFPRYR